MSDALFDSFCTVMDGLSLRPGQQIIIALGGGADSQTVLDCAMRYHQQHDQYRYLAVHLDHSFHPNSAAWSETIQKAAKAYGVTTHFEPLTVPIESRQSKEAAGRERRYQRLRELSDNDAIILLGQHRNDQIETFLLQLNRGSGPKGLASMAEVHCWYDQRRLVRPLLAVSKQDIYDYANARQLTWIEDDTNYDTRIERNFLRHDVIPLLEQRWPTFGDSVLRSARLCAEQQQVLDDLLSEKLSQQWVKHPLLGKGLPVDTLRRQSAAMQRAILRRWLEIAACESASLPSFQQLEQIRQQASDARADTRMCVSCADYEVRFYQMALWCIEEQNKQTATHVKLTKVGTYSLASPWGQLIITEALVNEADLTLGYGLLPGKWQHPQRKGRKTMADWLKQAQVPAWLRQCAPCLQKGSIWAWLPGVGWLHQDANAGSAMTPPPQPQWLSATD